MAAYDYTYANGWQAVFEGANGILAKIDSHANAAAFLSYGIPGTIYVQSLDITLPNGVKTKSNYAYTYAPDARAEGFSFENSVLNGADQIMTVRERADQNDTIDAFRAGGGLLTLTLDRIIFHELVHGLVAQNTHKSWVFVDSIGRAVNMSETIAVLAENLYYANDSSQYRVGHVGYDTKLSITSAPVGVEMFAGQALPTISFGIDSTSLVSTNQGFSITRTFYEVGHNVGMSLYANYVTDRIDYGDGASLVQKSGGISNITSVATGMLGNLMAPSAPGVNISTALSVIDAMDVLRPGYYQHAYGSLIGIDRNRILDASNIPGTDANNPVDITGPVALGSFVTAGELGIQVEDAAGTIAIGASGFWVGSSTYEGILVTPQGHNALGSVDYLVGGSKSDILIAGTGAAAGKANSLYGMGGDDVLMGGVANDFLDGGGDNDILISSSGNDTLAGGGGFDVGYFGNQASRILYRYGVVTGAPGLHSTISDDVEAIVGTGKTDTFYGDGRGMTFYGGNDTANNYYAADAPDTFINRFEYNYADGRLDFSLLSGGIDLTTSGLNQGGTTTAGHSYIGIANVRGTEHIDTFHLEDGTGSNNSYWGGGDNDTFYIGSAVRNAYGEDGNDHFYILTTYVGGKFDGGTDADGNDVDILDFSRMTVPSTVKLNLQNHTFASRYGDDTFLNFERFVFGATPMYMTGTSGIDYLESGSGKSYINGGLGDDVIVVTAADGLTPAGYEAGYGYAVVDGGGDNDVITAYRAATINGGNGNDIITGSNFKDAIHGGLGNDIINAMGGDDYFFDYDLQGIDHIDAGEGIDALSLTSQISNFDFMYVGGEFGVQRTGSANDGNRMLFTNLDKVYVGYSSYYYDVVDAIQVLTADPDHYMTGTEMGAAIRTHRATNRSAAADAPVSFDEAGSDDGGVGYPPDWPSDWTWFQDEPTYAGFRQGDPIEFHAESARGAAMPAQTIAFERDAGVGDLDVAQDPYMDPMGFLASHLQMPLHHDLMFI